MKSLKLVLVLGTVIFSLGSFATEQNDPNYILGSVQIEQIESAQTPMVEKESYSLPEINDGLGQVIMITDKLIALGEKIWKIIEAGKPVVNANGIVPTISVLPKGITEDGSFDSMYGWSDPKVTTYKVTYKNLYGVEVIRFEFSVMMQYGGTDGKGGKYLTGISVFPGNIYAAWGWNFNASSALIGITNKGTATAPVAGATLELSYDVATPMNVDKNKIRFHVDANGKMVKLN